MRARVPAREEAVLAETLNRLSFLREVGPGCLTLDRLRTAQARFADGLRVPETCVPAGKNSRTKKRLAGLLFFYPPGQKNETAGGKPLVGPFSLRNTTDNPEHKPHTNL